MKKQIYVPAILLIFLSYSHSFGQSWMSGFNYRKKITIDKSKVIAKTVVFGSNNTVDYDLVDFPVLIDIVDRDLIYNGAACGSKIQDIGGRDISFALSTAPTVPLNFQVESYDPVTGRITCWVKINALSANKTTTPATAIFLYYGGSTPLHNPMGTAALNTWNANYSKVWHMNSIQQEDGIHQLTTNGLGTFSTGLIGKGMELTDSSTPFVSGKEESIQLSISGWIRLSQTGVEQVIIGNDSTASGGFVLKVNTADRLMFDIYRGSTLTGSITGTTVSLTANVWYHITALYSSNVGSIYLNGIPIGGASGSTLRMGAGGSIRIGHNRPGAGKFKGKIDELRIQRISIGAEWLKTEYANQINPSSFYSVSAEEYNPAGFNRFTGTGNQWNINTNWSMATVPGINSNVIIPAGKSVWFESVSNPPLGKLIIESGATLTLASDLEIGCIAEIFSGGSIKINDGATIKIASNLYNNGSITTAASGGSILFSGTQEFQKYEGAGTFKVFKLLNEQFSKNNTLLLNAPMTVTGVLQLKKGNLNSNGFLTLASTSQTNTATVFPIQNTSDAAITGNVNVQQHISGDYPEPANARGWRLLSSPVYNGNATDVYGYGLEAYKNSIFVTGSGGAVNGFDLSPLNGGTIYTHNQALAGTLSQKYIAIKNINEQVPIGHGVYVFSRGSRLLSGAYQQQVQGPVFTRPSSYTLTHIGKIFSGDLQITLSNKNSGSEGDGFNLLGNPYPAPIRWGSLTTQSIVPFIWQFDPMNNAYVVSDSPETIIPSGTGFFVRVSSGQSNGSLTFRENSKYTGKVNTPPTLQTVKSDATVPSLPRHIFDISITRGPLSQHYILKCTTEGYDGINDADAQKIGDGILNVFSITEGAKLAVEDREFPLESKEFPFVVKGTESGPYVLHIDEQFTGKRLECTLIDTYLGMKKRITDTDKNYTFQIDKNVAATEGEKRFKLLIKPSEINSIITKEDFAYPNPFQNKIFIKTNQRVVVQVCLRTILGNIIFKQSVSANNNLVELDTEKLASGVYFLTLTNQNTGQMLKCAKLVKN